MSKRLRKLVDDDAKRSKRKVKAADDDGQINETIDPETEIEYTDRVLENMTTRGIVPTTVFSSRMLDKYQERKALEYNNKAKQCPHSDSEDENDEDGELSIEEMIQMALDKPGIEKDAAEEEHMLREGVVLQRVTDNARANLEDEEQMALLEEQYGNTDDGEVIDVDQPDEKSFPNNPFVVSSNAHEAAFQYSLSAFRESRGKANGKARTEEIAREKRAQRDAQTYDNADFDNANQSYAPQDTYVPTRLFGPSVAARAAPVAVQLPTRAHPLNYTWHNFGNYIKQGKWRVIDQPDTADRVVRNAEFANHLHWFTCMCEENPKIKEMFVTASDKEHPVWVTGPMAKKTYDRMPDADRTFRANNAIRTDNTRPGNGGLYLPPSLMDKVRAALPRTHAQSLTKKLQADSKLVKEKADWKWLSYINRGSLGALMQHVATNIIETASASDLAIFLSTVKVMQRTTKTGQNPHDHWVACMDAMSEEEQNFFTRLAALQSISNDDVHRTLISRVAMMDSSETSTSRDE
jgi:hypothetical protein